MPFWLGGSIVFRFLDSVRELLVARLRFFLSGVPSSYFFFRWLFHF